MKKRYKTWDELDCLSIAQQAKEWKKVLEEITNRTGFSLNEMQRSCYVLVKDRNSKYFGQIGLLDYHNSSFINEETYSVRFKPKGDKRVRNVKFTGSRDELENKLYCVCNGFMLLEEIDNMWKLFPD